VTLAVYTYFLSCIMGRQYLIPDHRDNTTHAHSGSNSYSALEELDLIFPVFTTLQVRQIIQSGAKEQEALSLISIFSF